MTTVYPMFKKDLKKKKKKRRERDEGYLNFIRSQPCIICGKKSVAHHEPLKGRGISSKGPDNETLPLCNEHHTTGTPNRHMAGRKTFYEYFVIDWRKEVVKYQLIYEQRSRHGKR